MLTESTSLKLVHAVTDQSIADQIALRLITATPANQAAAQALLATMDVTANTAADIRYRLATGLAGDNVGEAGLDIATRLEAIVAVIAAKAAGTSLVAPKAALNASALKDTTALCLAHALASQDAADEFAAALAAANTAAAAIS